MTGAPFPQRPRLCFVAAAPPRPRRIDVRIAATDGRAPHGRSRALKLTESDLAWLIEAAERLEARR
jgi:hypothetical protein